MLSDNERPHGVGDEAAKAHTKKEPAMRKAPEGRYATSIQAGATAQSAAIWTTTISNIPYPRSFSQSNVQDIPKIVQILMDQGTMDRPGRGFWSPERVIVWRNNMS